MKLDSKEKRDVLWLSMLGIAVLSIAVGAFFLHVPIDAGISEFDSFMERPAVSAPPAEPEPEIVAPPPTPITGVSVRKISIKKCAEGTQLWIQTDQRMPYRIEGTGLRRRIEIVLEGAHLDGAFDSIDLDDTPIQSWQTRKEADRLVLTLALDTTARVLSGWLDAEAGTMLVVDIKPSARRTALKDPPAPKKTRKKRTLTIERSADDRRRRDRRMSRNAMLDRVHSLAQSERWDEGIEVIRGARIDAPDDVQLLLLHARLIARTQTLDAAIQILDGSKFDLSKTPEISALSAVYLQQSKEHARAIARYESLLRRFPGESRWWMGLGISLEATGRGSEALDAYQISAELGALPNASRLWVSGRIEALRGEG